MFEEMIRQYKLKSSVEVLKEYFDINWMTLKIGFIDYRLLSAKEVTDYAANWCSENKLFEGSEFELCLAYENEKNLIQKHLKKLSSVYNEEQEKKKYYVLGLMEVLKSLPEDSIEASIEILGFWSYIDWPVYAPDFNFLKDNTFGTEAVLEELKKINKEWIEEQINK